MSHSKKSRMPSGIAFLFENSLFLVAGALAALIWANVNPGSYHRFVHFDLGQQVLGLSPPAHDEPDSHAPAGTEHDEAGHEASHEAGDSGQNAHGETDESSHSTDSSAGSTPVGLVQTIYHAFSGTHGLTIHFLINDMLMALFFAIAGKEVWESLLPGGALANPRKAATPLMATLGGVVGPAAIYLGGAALLGELSTLGRGWAIPCATDIAFSYLVARLVFGVGHPAIAFLLLLAIADDAAGLVILAVFYPQQPLEPWWFVLTLVAILLAIGMRRLRFHSFWWYLLIPGVMSWLSFKLAGVHAALGLVPIIPILPHAHTDLGIFARQELQRHDTLNEFEHWWKNPVELILGLFGLANAGVVLSSVGNGTWLVLFGLLLGKPLGITLMTWVSERMLGLEVPAGMRYRHVVSLGVIAAIGFTVALFVSTAAFPQTGPIQDSVKMGALASFLAAPIAIAVARALGVRPEKLGGEAKPAGDESDARDARMES